MSGDGLSKRPVPAPVGTDWHKIALAGLVLLRVITTGGNVLWVRSVHLMQGHAYFLTQVVFPLSINIMCWPVVWMLGSCGRISAEERRTPRWKFAALAVMAGVWNLLAAFPTAALPGALQTVLGTTKTPVLMVLSCAILGTRYRWQHYVASAMIVAAATLVVGPHLADVGAITGTQVLWIFVFVGVFFIPVDIYAEKWMKDVNMNIFYYRANMAVFEVALGIVLLPTLLLPGLPGRDAVPWHELGSHLGDAWQCFCGVAATATDSGGVTLGAQGAARVVCHDQLPVWQIWTGFMTLGLVHIMSGFALIKYGSAVLYSVVTAVSLPVAIIMFQWQPLAGAVVQHGLGWNTIVAGVVAAAGVFLYASSKERSRQRQLSLVRSNNTQPDLRLGSQPLSDVIEGGAHTPVPYSRRGLAPGAWRAGDLAAREQPGTSHRLRDETGLEAGVVAPQYATSGGTAVASNWQVGDGTRAAGRGRQLVQPLLLRAAST